MTASPYIQTAAATAILVIGSRSGLVLCPFFDKCDGVLLIEREGNSAKFHDRDHSGAKSLCDLILELKPGGLVCGFIGEAEKQRLCDAGVDVRLGSCSCSIDELFVGFYDLPRA